MSVKPVSYTKWTFIMHYIRNIILCSKKIVRDMDEKCIRYIICWVRRHISFVPCDLVFNCFHSTIRFVLDSCVDWWPISRRLYYQTEYKILTAIRPTCIQTPSKFLCARCKEWCEVTESFFFYYLIQWKRLPKKVYKLG